MADDAAFEVLGRIGVDRAELNKSLKEAEGDVRASAQRMKKDWEGAGGPGGPNSPFKKPPVPPGGGAPPASPPVPGGGGGGVLGMIGPTAGITLAITAATAAQAVLASYWAEARKATEQTQLLGDAWANLDKSGIDAALKKATTEISAYNLAVDIAEGKVEAGFWQKIVAWADIAAEAVTGSVDKQIRDFEKLALMSGKIAREVELPKAKAQAEGKAADLMARQAQLAKQNAASEIELAAAYDKSEASVRAKTKADLAELDAQEKLDTIRLKAQGQGVGDAIMKAADAARKKSFDEADAQAREGLITTRNASQQKAEAERQYTEEKIRAGRAVTASDTQVAVVLEANNLKRKSMLDSEKQSLVENADARQKALARIEADEEKFTQRQIARNQQRIASIAQTAVQIMAAEESIQQAKRAQFGVVESESNLEKRLADQRIAATAPIVAGIQAANEKYQSQKRELEDLIAANIDVIKNTRELADLEKSSAEEVNQLRRRLTAERAALEAKEFAARMDRVKQEVAEEDKRFAHRASTGRVSMTDQISRETLNAVDPRRSLEQQEAAERQALELKKKYADEYFRYYQSIGASTWEQQLQAAEGFLSQTVQGSEQWFSAVQKVADVYKGIHDQAKSIYSQEVSIAEQEARRAGRKKISINDVGKLVEQARRRDARALGGGKVDIGDLSGALGRQDLWKTVDREGLNPAQAFQKMQQDPQAQLRDSIARVSTSFETASGVAKSGMTSVSEAAGGAAQALNELTAAALAAAGAMGGSGQGEQPESRRPERESSVLPTAAGNQYGNIIPPGVDTALGRTMRVGNRRSPNTIDTVTK